MPGSRSVGQVCNHLTHVIMVSRGASRRLYAECQLLSSRVALSFIHKHPGLKGGIKWNVSNLTGYERIE